MERRRLCREKEKGKSRDGADEADECSCSRRGRETGIVGGSGAYAGSACAE